MSYTVNGCIYHSIAERDAARRRLAEEEAAAEAEQYRRRATSLGNQLRNRMEELGRTRGDLQRQIRVNQGVQNDGRAISDTQSRLARAQERATEQANRRYQETRSELTRQQGELHGLAANQIQLAGDLDALGESTRQAIGEVTDEIERQGADIQALGSEIEGVARWTEQEFRAVHGELQQQAAEIDALDVAHRQHVEAVRREFVDVRHEMAEGLEEAERRREETERRLQAEIDRVEAELEKDRAERLAKEQDEASRARVLVTMAQEETQQHDDAHCQRLRLDGERNQAELKQLEVFELLETNNTAAALAAAHGAMTGARSLTYRAMRREAELVDMRERLMQRSQEVAGSLEDEAIQEYFEAEAGQARRIAARIEREAAESYDRYGRLDVQADRHERQLDKLEEQALVINATTPIVRRQARDRAEVAPTVVKRLADIYGPLTGVEQRYATPHDPKSAKIVECNFDGVGVDVHLDIDGSYTVDGYGHASNRTCGSRAQAVVRAMQAEGEVTEQQVDTQNRSEACVTTAAEAANQVDADAWRGVTKGLDKLEDDL